MPSTQLITSITPSQHRSGALHPCRGSRRSCCDTRRSRRPPTRCRRTSGCTITLLVTTLSRSAIAALADSGYISWALRPMGLISNHISHNSFFWWMSHDQLAQRARYTNMPKEYYIIEFGHAEVEGGIRGVVEPHVNCLRWKHEFGLQEGELFRRDGYVRLGPLYEHDLWQNLLGP